MKWCTVPVTAVLSLLLLSAAQAQEPNEKARKYYDSLLKRPAPGVVFDRFYNAWLDTGTLEEMEKFLIRAAGGPEDNGAARMVLAFYYAKQNEHAKAALEFGKALERNPGSAAAWHQKALAEARLLDYTSALASLEKALAAKPDKTLEGQLTQLKGRLVARDGRTDEALKIWRQLLAASPGDAALQEDIIELQIAEGLNKEALATAQALLAQTTDPYQKVQRRLRVGDLQARAGDRDAAVAAYTECLDDTGADSWLEKEILAQIEQVFRRDDAVDALNTHFDSLLKKYPQRLSLHRRRARLLAEKSDVDGAVKTYQEILKLAPGDRAVREDYIALLSQTKKTAEAVAQMEELIRIQPMDAELAARLAELQFEAGNATGAAAAAELFLSKSDQSEAAFLRTAALLERCTLADPALALYRRTAEKFSGSESALDALALALHRNGHKDEAATEWRKLAAGANKSRLCTVARSAATRDEHTLAWEFLIARAAEFQNDPVFLTQLCEEAARTDKYAEALPYGRMLVTLAKDAAAMEAALTVAVRTAEHAKATAGLLTELAAASTPQDRCLLAELLEKAGKRPEAEAALGSIAKDAPELAAALQVRLFAGRGDDAAAARALQGLVESPAGSKPAHVQRLVELFSRAGKPEEALKWIPVWKRLSPGAAAPWQREAAIHLEAGRTTQALRILRQAAALFEDNADLKSALAAACREEGKYADAMRLYTAMYEDAKDIPDKVRFAGELARTAKAADKMQDLIESFEERHRSNRTSVAPLLSLAEVHRVTEDYEARRTVLLEAARLAPDNKDLRLEIIRTAESEGDWDHAIQTMRDLAAADPSGAMSLKLAATFFNAGREEEALKLMASLTASGKVDARGAEAMASSLAAAQSWTECAQFLAPLVAKFPADYRLAYLHAVALEESGELPSALAAFNRLISLKDEMPSVRPAASATPASAGAAASLSRSSMMTSVITRLLPELKDFQRTGQSINLGYGYRRNQRSGFSYLRSGAGAGSPVTLPPTVDDVKIFVLPHLKELTADDERARAGTAAALEAAGMRDADVYLEMAPSRDGRSRVDPPDLYAKYPDRLTLQLIMAAGAIAGNRVERPVMAELAAKLRTSRPQVANLVAMSLTGSDDPEHIKLATSATKEMVALAETDTSARMAIVTLVLPRLMSQVRRDAAAGAKVSYQGMESLYPRLSQWYAEMDQADRARPATFYVLVSHLLQKKDFAALFKLLDDEVASGTPGPALQPGRLYRTSATPAQPLGFPQTGEDFSPIVVSVLDLSPNSYSPVKGQLILTTDELRPLLPAVKSPALRMLLAVKSQDAGLQSDAAAALTALPNPTFTEGLLLAGRLEKDKRYEEAAEVLKKAARPLSPQGQQIMDGALVFWGLSRMEGNSEKAPEKSPLIKAAREAALRLRTAVVEPESREKLASALVLLGLPEEAARYTASSPKAPRQTLSSRPPQPPPPKDRAETMISSGRKEAAVQLVLKELRELTRVWMAENRSNSGMSSGTTEWKQRVTKLGLVDDLMKVADPGPSGDATALVTLAVAPEIFLGPDKSLEVYRKALAAKPKSQEIFELGLRAALKAKPAEAPSLLLNSDPALLSKAGPVLLNFSYSNLKVAERIATLEALAQWLEKLEPAVRRQSDMSWATSWITQLSNAWGGEDPPQGLRIPLNKEGNVSDEIAKNRARWYTAAQKAAVLLTENEREAPQAFSVFVELRGYNEPDAGRSEPDRMARGILEAYLRGKKSGNSRSSSAFFWLPANYGSEWMSDRDNRNGRISPGEWLLQSAVLEKKPASITGDILPRLREGGMKVEADLLETITNLYFCPEGEFAAAVLSTVTPKQGLPVNTSLLDRIVGVMRDRNLDVDLSAPLIAAVKTRVEEYGQDTPVIATYCRYLKRHGGFKAVSAFYSRITELTFGPAAERAALIAKEYRRNGWSSGTVNGRIHSWSSQTSALSREADLALNMLSALENEFLAYCPNPEEAMDNSSQVGGVLVTSPFYRKPVEEVMAFFRGTPVLADTADFNLPVITAAYGPQIPADFFKAMRAREVRPNMEKAFSAEPQTLGTAFMKAALAESPPDALLTLAGQRAEEFGKLSRERQLRLAKLFRIAIGKDGKPKDAGEIIAKGQEWLRRTEESSVLLELEKVMAGKLASQISPSPQEYGRKVLKMLQALLVSDPDRALQLFLHAREQVASDRAAGTQNEDNRYIQSGDAMRLSVSVLGSALTASAKEAKSIPHADPRLPNIIAAITAMSATDKGCGVESNLDLSMHTGDLLIKAGKAPGKDGKFTLQQLVATAGPVLKPEWMPVLLGPARHAMWTTDIKKNDGAQSWLEQQAKDGPHRDFAMLLLTAARISREEKDADNKTRAGVLSAAGLPPEQQWLIAQLEKKSVPPAALAAF
ncbi:MAG TPA: tetratricopeptide repeat protein, partial [Verrucomicrobiales bacterium]|nr:tetratricopeptide repeat protein [Verrucomicrobiales bacterium]